MCGWKIVGKRSKLGKRFLGQSHITYTIESYNLKILTLLDGLCFQATLNLHIFFIKQSVYYSNFQFFKFNRDQSMLGLPISESTFSELF